MSNVCSTCKERPGMHTLWKGGKTYYFCCVCNINQGEPPADWHPECMKAWRERTENV